MKCIRPNLLEYGGNHWNTWSTLNIKWIRPKWQEYGENQTLITSTSEIDLNHLNVKENSLDLLENEVNQTWLWIRSDQTLINRILNASEVNQIWFTIIWKTQELFNNFVRQISEGFIPHFPHNMYITGSHFLIMKLLFYSAWAFISAVTPKAKFEVFLFSNSVLKIRNTKTWFAEWKRYVMSA